MSASSNPYTFDTLVTGMLPFTASGTHWLDLFDQPRHLLVERIVWAFLATLAINWWWNPLIELLGKKCSDQTWVW